MFFWWLYCSWMESKQLRNFRAYSGFEFVIKRNRFGRGVYLTKRNPVIQVGEAVLVFSGRRIREEELDAWMGDYVVAWGALVCVPTTGPEPYPTADEAAFFVNTPPTKRHQNVRLEKGQGDYPPKFVAIKRIFPGQEIFGSYGSNKTRAVKANNQAVADPPGNMEACSECGEFYIKNIKSRRSHMTQHTVNNRE